MKIKEIEGERIHSFKDGLPVDDSHIENVIADMKSILLHKVSVCDDTQHVQTYSLGDTMVIGYYYPVNNGNQFNIIVTKGREERTYYLK